MDNKKISELQKEYRKLEKERQNFLQKADKIRIKQQENLAKQRQLGVYVD